MHFLLLLLLLFLGKNIQAMEAHAQPMPMPALLSSSEDESIESRQSYHSPRDVQEGNFKALSKFLNEHTLFFSNLEQVYPKIIQNKKLMNFLKQIRYLENGEISHNDFIWSPNLETDTFNDFIWKDWRAFEVAQLIEEPNAKVNEYLGTKDHSWRVKYFDYVFSIKVLSEIAKKGWQNVMEEIEDSLNNETNESLTTQKITHTSSHGSYTQQRHTD